MDIRRLLHDWENWIEVGAQCWGITSAECSKPTPMLAASPCIIYAHIVYDYLHSSGAVNRQNLRFRLTFEEFILP